MREPVEGELLRVHVGATHKYKGRPLYEVIVERARQQGLAGATVLRGAMGFGVHQHMHTPKILALSENLPMVVEIIDIPEKIAQFLPILDEIMDQGVATLEKVRMLSFSSG